MSRSIHIGYAEASGKYVDIKIRPPYFLLGTQDASTKFWRAPRLKEVGIVWLTTLGETDPLSFQGWDDMHVLRREIELLATHLGEVDFDPEVKASWLSHLTYCFHLLIASTPTDGRPSLSIG